MAITTSGATRAQRPLDIDAVMNRYFAAWEARDPDRIAGLHTADTQFWVHGAAPPVAGRDEMRAAAAQLFEQFPGFGFRIHRTITGARHWVLDWAMTAVLSADGRSWPISVDCLDVITVDDDGLVARKDTYFDNEHLQRALAGPDGSAR